MVKDIKDDSLNLDEAVVREPKDNTRKDMMTDQDIEIGDMEN